MSEFGQVTVITTIKNMRQKFKTELKCPSSPPSPLSMLYQKKNDLKHLMHINNDKGNGLFCVFALLPHYYVHEELLLLAFSVYKIMLQS